LFYVSKTNDLFYNFEEEQLLTALKLQEVQIMGDLTADKNQSSDDDKKSIFDSFKFWGQVPRHRNSHSVDINKSPQKTIDDDSTDQSPIKTIDDDSSDQSPIEKLDNSSPDNVKLYETISGNYIITRGWDDNNMMLFKIRRKIL
jgi:hypothetical protein